MSSGTSPALMANYGRMDVLFERGAGVRLYDTEGREYFDALCGIAVCGLGHAHPAVTAAVADQAATLVHTSNLYRIALQEQLAEKLADLSGMERAFFCNSGAEANEAAFKIARKYGHDKGIDDPLVIAMDGSFHGRTMATLSATGNPKVHAGFTPLVAGYKHIPFDDVDAIGSASGAANVVAIMVEPIQGEGGIVMSQPGYLKAIRDICDDRGLLMLVDEVQTGIARTGEWFGFQHEPVVPDVISLAKGLGNGVPIGACLARGKAAEVLTAGTHGSTFGGNPLACRAALAVIETIETQGLVARAAALGERLISGFAARLGGLDQVAEVRGRGLMVGIRLRKPCTDLIGQALTAGVLLNVTGDNVVRLLPPMIMTDDEADELIDRVSQLIETFLASQ
ncbi:MAG: acetylornithine transaminase [Gammaproteobacteria bacterium]